VPYRSESGFRRYDPMPVVPGSPMQAAITIAASLGDQGFYDL
jgi:hypothetical protein